MNNEIVRKQPNKENSGSLGDLLEQLNNNQQFHSAIKAKRIRKELIELEKCRSESVIFKRFQLTCIGIQITLLHILNTRKFPFLLRIDYEYPFNRPQIFYLKNGHYLSECKDLLDTVMQGKYWGPSIMLDSIIKKIGNLSAYINEDSANALWKYHLKENYSKIQLKRCGFVTVETDLYEWKFMIKQTKKILLALSRNTILFFIPSDNPQICILHAFYEIKNIVNAKAEIWKNTYSLQISYKEEEEKISKVYLGGNKKQAQQILYFINPLQMLERKAKNLEKAAKQGQKNQEQIVECYTKLIEHHSLKGEVDAIQKYVKLIQELIKEAPSIPKKNIQPLYEEDSVHSEVINQYKHELRGMEANKQSIQLQNVSQQK